MDGAGASGPYPAVAGSRNGTGAAAGARLSGSGVRGGGPSPASPPRAGFRPRGVGPRGRYAATSRRAAAVSLEA